jgi:hypothetical protein
MFEFNDEESLGRPHRQSKFSTRRSNQSESLIEAEVQRIKEATFRR